MNEESRQKKLDRIAELTGELPVQIPGEVTADFPEHELTLTQFKAMTYLLQGPRRMGDIARFLDASLSSVTNLVSRLESKGLVQRTHDTTDRRVVTCELTEEGNRAVTWIWQIGQQRLLLIVRFLEDDELDQIINAFELLLDAARRARRQSDNG